MTEEPLFRELEQLLTGMDNNDDVIPALIIACARALTIEAGGDASKLLAGIHKFHLIVAEQAHDMFMEERPPDDRQPVSN